MVLRIDDWQEREVKFVCFVLTRRRGGKQIRSASPSWPLEPRSQFGLLRTPKAGHEAVKKNLDFFSGSTKQNSSASSTGDHDLTRGVDLFGDGLARSVAIASHATGAAGCVAESRLGCVAMNLTMIQRGEKPSGPRGQLH